MTDLEQIANGEQPSTASMKFFQWAQKSGDVFRYEIYNRRRLFAARVRARRGAMVNLSEFSADAVRSLQSDQPVVDVHGGHAPGRPSFYARAYVPVLVDGRPVAIVAAYVDQTATARHVLPHIRSSRRCRSACWPRCRSGCRRSRGTTERKEKQQADQRIRFLAHHDALTGLPNRASLIESLNSALAGLPPVGAGLALHFFDIDRFKAVNDTLGHDGGDFLLETMAQRLRAVVRPGDVVARLGGDEFVAVQTR